MSCETVARRRRMEILAAVKMERRSSVSWWRRNQPDLFYVSKMALEIKVKDF